MNLSFKAQLVFCLCQLHHSNLSLIWTDVNEGVRFPSKPLFFQIRHCRKDTIRKRIKLGSTYLAGLSDAAIIVQCKISRSLLGNRMFFLFKTGWLLVSVEDWLPIIIFITHSCKRTQNHLDETCSSVFDLIKVLCEQTRELTHDSLDYV